MQRALCPILVGRDDELARLEDALLAAHRGDGSVVLLSGEAGIGKSRLAEDLERRARLAGMTVMRGGCSDAEFAVPYLPVVEAVGNSLTGADLKALVRELGSAVHELARLFPQLGTPRGRVPDDPAQGKARLFESILTLLRIASAEQGLLLLIEDLHWADGATLDFLDYAQRRLPRERMLLLLTSRVEDLEENQRLARLLASWRRTGAAEIIDLEPLRPEHVGAMVNAIFEGHRVGQAFTDFLQARTEGNPFAVEELLKAALDRGDIFRSDLGWGRKALTDFAPPRTIKDLVLSRVARLSDGDREVARAAAVLGPMFQFEPLVGLSQKDESTVIAALRNLIQQQLMDERPVPGTYQFRHVLSRDAIYDDLIGPERRRLHERAAEVLRRLPGVATVDLASHLMEAGHWEQAVPVCIKAAEDAERRLAYQEAAALYERVLPHVTGSPLRTSLTCRWGNALYLAGDRQRAAAALEDGVRLLEEANSLEDAAHYRLVLGRSYWERSQHERARAEYERARAYLEPAGPSEDLALAYIRLSGLFDFEFRPKEALTMAERAVEVAEAAGADAMRIWAYNYLGLGLVGTGRLDEGIRFLDRSYQEAAARGLEWIAGSALSNGIAIRLEHFQGREALPLLAKLRDLRGRRRDILAYFYEGLIRLAMGDPETARRSSDEGITEAEAAGATTFQGWLESNLAMTLSALGRFDEAWAVLQKPHSKLERQDAMLRAYATMRVAVDTGEIGRAVAEVPALVGAIDWSRPLVAQERQVLDKAVEALLAAGQLGDAEELAARVQQDRGGRETPYVARIEGRVHLARQRLAPARERLGWVADYFARIGYRDEEWRTRLALAEALAAVGDRDGAERERGMVAAEEAARPEPAHAVPLGERLVTTMFVDVRGYTSLSQQRPPAEITERLGAFFRWTRQEIDRHQGMVDQYAGDAVMATFNVAQLRLEHGVDALQAALAIRDKAAFAGLPVGIGIATGPAVVGEVAAGSKIMTVGETANLAARLEAEAAAGEILLSAESYRRARDWLAGKALAAAPEQLTLKGFTQPATAYRLAAPKPAKARH